MKRIIISGLVLGLVFVCFIHPLTAKQITALYELLPNQTVTAGDYNVLVEHVMTLESQMKKLESKHNGT